MTHSKQIKSIHNSPCHNKSTYIFNDNSSAIFYSPQWIEAHTDVVSRVTSSVEDIRQYRLSLPVKGLMSI